MINTPPPVSLFVSSNPLTEQTPIYFAIPTLLLNHRFNSNASTQRGVVRNNLITIPLIAGNSSTVPNQTFIPDPKATLEAPSDMISRCGGLGIIHLNVRSLIQKLDLIELLVSQSNVDI